MPPSAQKRTRRPLKAGYALEPHDFIELVRSFPRFAAKGPNYSWTQLNALACWSCIPSLPRLETIVGETDIARTEETGIEVDFTLFYCCRSFSRSSLDEFGAERESDKRTLEKFASIVKHEGGKFDLSKVRWIPNVGPMTLTNLWGDVITGRDQTKRVD
ncbi:hypothetical protein DL96DRAFT_1713726 [Flagelloscypha sp. PMI_526]|nr:hypothetical protein DL96DRAFT_1713726 [Flagelloscypha sp. PMI_526]